jgi:hypothetical protein
MKKPLIIAVLIHAAILSFVWVGFSVPHSKSYVGFMYDGSYMPAESFEEEAFTRVRQSASQPLPVKTAEGSLFAPWVGMRALEKPKK